MLEVILAIFLGIFLGVITGLIPGIHTNLVALILISLSSYALSIFSPIQIVIFIVSMGLTNSFVDTIPSIFLGAPDDETALSVLPGHKMLLEGKGHEAVMYTVVGSFIAVIIFLVLTPLFFIGIPYIQNFVEKMMAFFLIWACIFFIYREKSSKIRAIIIFVLAGFLGIVSLNMGATQPLLPLLTGLFGTSTLIYSISLKSIVPKQNIDKIKISWKEIKKPTIATSITSPICSFLPGMGASQSAIIGSEIMRDPNKKSFLVLIGSTNTLVLCVSFLILYLTGRKRTGLASAISQIINLTFKDFLVIVGTIIIVSVISVFLTAWLSKSFAKIIDKINYTKISKIIILFLIWVTLIISGFSGIIILIVSTLLGLTCVHLGVRKGFLMGCLLVPTLFYYLPI